MPTLSLAQDSAADELLGRDPLALLIGMLLDQQPAQVLGAPGHRAGIAVQRRRPLEDPDQRLGVGRRQVDGGQ